MVVMKWHEVERDVFYPDSTLVMVTQADLRFVVEKAKASPRRRARLCAHPHATDGLHEMVICLVHDGYVRPHRHSKIESALIIEGECDLVLFDEQGNIAQVKSFSDRHSGQPFFVRIAEPIYHTYLIAKDFLLFLETTPGPFDRTRTQQAPWAPTETEEFSNYQQELVIRVRVWKENERADAC